MIVFRVERDGVGPYHAPLNGAEALDLAPYGSYAAPSPQSEGIRDFPCGALFGFRSFDSARRWFGGCARALADAGFRLVIWLTEEVYGVGYKSGQVAFKPLGPRPKYVLPIEVLA